MATVLFYEKPGCINNTRQKKLLKAAGHTLEVYNLLTTAWTVNELKPFFKDLAVEKWFNASAPRIKSGEIDPSGMDEETALARMIEEPLLIRRPLMQVGEQRCAGFDTGRVDEWIGLQETGDGDDLETCPRGDKQSSCE